MKILCRNILIYALPAGDSLPSAMGTPASRPTGEPAGHAPMWVVQVAHVLEMRKMQLHETLKAQKLLMKWNPNMLTIFVSHQWLRGDHPDPTGQKLRVLQGFLRNLIHKKLRIECDVVSQFHGGKVCESQLARVAEACMWLDYFCVPQRRSPESAEEQLEYIQCIPTYVNLSDVFLALVPKANHLDTGASCTMHSWLQRGWCRTELWCKYLSSRPNSPIVVVKDEDMVQATMPLWQRYPVLSGDFAIEDDRVSCNLVIQKALTQYISELHGDSSRAAYLLYLSLYEEMTGLPKKKRSVEEFLQDFCFPDVTQNGLGPVACASLSGDHELVRSLVIAKASMDTRAPGMPEVFNVPDLTPLHLAAFFRSHDLKVLETLLQLRADPNSSTFNAPTPLSHCSTAAAVDLLVRYRAQVNCQGDVLAQFCPIHLVCAVSAPREVLLRLLELRADVSGGQGGLATGSPLQNVAFSGDSENDLRNAELLLESRADINQVCQPQGIMRSLELMARAMSACTLGEESRMLKWFSNLSTTPLGWCALFDNEGLLIFLLSKGADPEIRNNRGLRPIDMASSERIREILRHEGLITETL